MNSIDSLPENIFSGLNSLEEIHLHHNIIESLPENIYKNGLNSLPNIHWYEKYT